MYRPLIRRHRRGMLLGVCANIAERADIPTWVPRTLFVLLGLAHFMLGLMFYGLLAITFTRRQPLQACEDPYRRMDARVSDLEAATLDREAALRRAFKDLGA